MTSAPIDDDADLERARAIFRTGDILGAWERCERAASRARARGDAATIARAALVVRGLMEGSVYARVHALSREALVLLDEDEDEVLRARVQAQLAATADRWTTTATEHPATRALAEARRQATPRPSSSP